MASNYQEISEDEIGEVDEIFQIGGVKKVVELMKSKLDTWRTFDVRIAVTGNSGVGKSSFINAIRGLNADDEGAAQVGVTETTRTLTSFPHPNNPKLLFVDLPGVGTPNFPRNEYIERVHFNTFDFYIIISNKRFAENDKWLADEIKKQQKNFLFLRTKIDEDVENHRRSHPSTQFNEEELLNRIRQDCKKNLQEFKDASVYLISSYESERFDFSATVDKIVEDVPAIKKKP